MSLPVLIVDDSSMSRKITRRALPQGWDISISEAADGHQALEAYKAGKADVMFLDLTMPGMDGFEVLENLQKQGLDSFVIVISADVQEKARERVMKLGAMAFIKKPLKGDEVIRVLKDFGIYDPDSAAQPSEQAADSPSKKSAASAASNSVEVLSPDQQDALRELTNVAMGQAGASLAAMLDHFVKLSTPTACVVESKHLAEQVTDMLGPDADGIAAVRQAFFSQVRGEAIVLYGQGGCNSLADLLGHEGQLDTATERELLLDVGNLLVGAVLNGLGEQMQDEFNFSAPALMARSSNAERLLAPDRLDWRYALLVEVQFSLEERNFSCHLVMLMPEESIRTMQGILDKLLEGIQ